LDRIELRYWYRDESGQPFSFHCDWARLGCGVVFGDFKTTANGAQYLSLRFSQLAGELKPGEDTGEIKIRLNRSDWSAFDQASHYSFASQTEYASWQKVTIYFDGQLIWGTEPEGRSALAATPQPTAVANTLPPSTSPTASLPAAEPTRTPTPPAASELPGTALPGQPNGQGVPPAALLLIGLLAGLSLALLTIRIVRR
jgi:hypothetical protein